MPKVTLMPISIVGGLAIALMINILPLDAHQQKPAPKGVEVMLHLDPDDSPYAQKPSETWFMLMQKNGDMISPANCNCRIAAYNSRNQAIAHHLPLSPMKLEGHKQGHEASRTMITFPTAGAYTIVVSGRAKDKSFDPFELKFPIKVRP